MKGYFTILLLFMIMNYFATPSNKDYINAEIFAYKGKPKINEHDVVSTAMWNIAIIKHVYSLQIKSFIENEQ